MFYQNTKTLNTQIEETNSQNILANSKNENRAMTQSITD